MQSKVDAITNSLNAPVAITEVDSHIGSLTRDNARLRKAVTELSEHAAELFARLSEAELHVAQLLHGERHEATANQAEPPAPPVS